MPSKNKRRFKFIVELVYGDDKTSGEATRDIINAMQQGYYITSGWRDFRIKPVIVADPKGIK